MSQPNEFLGSLPPRARWEGGVYEQIETRLHVCSSDAEAIAMAQESLMDECWDEGKGAEKTAELIIQSATQF